MEKQKMNLDLFLRVFSILDRKFSKIVCYQSFQAQCVPKLFKKFIKIVISGKIREREANIAKQLALLQDLQQQFRQFAQDKEVIENFLAFTKNLLSSKKGDEDESIRHVAGVSTD